MSTKSKNPLLKRVRVTVTQEIIDKANRNIPWDCFFFHAINPLLIEECSLGYDYCRIKEIKTPLSKKAVDFYEKGIDKTKIKPTSFDLYLPVKYLK